jgi:NNMT/PNMT/TEMT family
MEDRDPETSNDSAAWSDFDADEYWKFNYASVLPEDAEIIRFASNFLINACQSSTQLKRAVDVGAGTNLYPSLLMLPWAEHIVLTEHPQAKSNIQWLNENLAAPTDEWPWQHFWDLVAERPGYRDVTDPRSRLAASHEVLRTSVFDLPERRWDLGSMFFVADGMSTKMEEFEDGVRKFLGSLIPGSPFVMAFMEGSDGYDVSDVRFPAVNIKKKQLEKLITSLPVSGTDILRTDKSRRPLRPNYEAMLVVTGFVTELTR